jgi:DNA invertase Pin-like site-specific DNA recombinase
MLVVLKLDRITRSVKDLGEILEKIEHENWSLSAVEESFDTSTASGRLALNVLMAVSQWEREAIGERTVTALEQKRKQGEKTGGSRPYGWDVVECKQ